MDDRTRSTKQHPPDPVSTAPARPVLPSNDVAPPPGATKPGIRELTRDEVEAQLKGTEASIDQRVEALEDEVSTIGSYLKERLLNNPLIGLGGALLGGLVVGWIFGGGRRMSATKAAEAALRVLVDRYMSAVVQEAQEAIRDGIPPEVAVREALLERMPVVPAPVQEREPSGLKRFLSLLGATLLRVSVAEGFSYLISPRLPKAPGSAGPEPGPSGAAASAEGTAATEL